MTKLRDESGRHMIVPAFGPAIPIVPRKDFNVGVSQEHLELFWSITGPSAMNNISNGRQLWEVIACAYAEGLHHGAKLVREMDEKKDPTKAYKEVPIKRGRKRNG